MPKALGLVETRGLVAAIEAADAMVKTSNVTLIGKEVTNPALITIKIVGDVAAVKASVDAGAAAAARVGELVSVHVIPQPDSQMTTLFPEIKDDDDPGGDRAPKPGRKKKNDSSTSSSETKSESLDSSADTNVIEIETQAEETSSEENTGGTGTASKPSAAGKPASESTAGLTAKEINFTEEKLTDSSTEDINSDPGKQPDSSARVSGRPVSAGKPADKAPVSKPVKTRAPKPKKVEESENLFSANLDHLERLRREALGIKEPAEEAARTKKPAERPAEKSTPETPVKGGPGKTLA